MTQTLQLFPIRAPIGTNVNGQVFMTPEFYRALNVVFNRLGATDGSVTDESTFGEVFAPFLSGSESQSLPETFQQSQQIDPIALEVTFGQS